VINTNSPELTLKFTSERALIPPKSLETLLNSSMAEKVFIQ